MLRFARCSDRLPACLLITKGLKVASCLLPPSCEGQRPETAGQGACLSLLRPEPAWWAVCGVEGNGNPDPRREQGSSPGEALRPACKVSLARPALGAEGCPLLCGTGAAALGRALPASESMPGSLRNC